MTMNFFLMDLDPYHQQNKCVIKPPILKNILWPHTHSVSLFPFITKWQERVDLSCFHYWGFPTLLYCSPSAESPINSTSPNLWSILVGILVNLPAALDVISTLVCFPLLDVLFIISFAGPFFPSVLKYPDVRLEPLLFFKPMSSQAISSGFKYHYHNIHIVWW